MIDSYHFYPFLIKSWLYLSKYVVFLWLNPQNRMWLMGLWPMVEGEQLHSCHYIDMRSNCLCDYTEKFKSITVVIFVFLIIETLKVSAIWENGHQPSCSYPGKGIWTGLTPSSFTWFGTFRLLHLPQDEIGAQWLPFGQRWCITSAVNHFLEVKEADFYKEGTMKSM